jgi:pimeloyl-ACP methyl ester carboxylesterase
VHALDPELVQEARGGLGQARRGVQVLLVHAPRPSRQEPVARFRAALPDARFVSIPDAIHDLVFFAPDEVADAVGTFVAETELVQPPP